MVSTKLTEMLQIKYPIIMAPMFLVSNTIMVIKAAKMGITGSIPKQLEVSHASLNDVAASN